MPAELLVVPARVAYIQIPATELRNFVDGVFPNLATNKIADSVSGFGHRYRAGHDLLLDVPSTFSTYGSIEGLKHAGHIILTDFPTKAGIPIPGFSHSGLGHLLEQVGISNGWLQISLFDSSVGIFAIADSAVDIAQALQGSLILDAGTACQTFGTGTVEISLAFATQNPLLLAGGIQNILAGIVSSWKSFSIYVDPLELLGAAGTSALLGFGITRGLLGENTSDSVRDSIRSGAIGALFKISASFGFGALAGFIIHRLGTELSKAHNRITENQLFVDDRTYQLFFDTLCEGNLGLLDILKISDGVALQSSYESISNEISAHCSSRYQPLDCQPRSLPSDYSTLNYQPEVITKISSEYLVLPSDPVALESLYNATWRICKNQ